MRADASFPPRHCRIAARTVRAAAAVIAWLVFGPTCYGLESLDDVINNVRANEELYKNIEYKFKHTYKLNKKIKPKDVVDLIEQESTGTNWVILQNGMHYENHREEASSVSGKLHDLNEVRGFDGETTRIYDQDAIGNIWNGDRHVSAPLPHMFLFVEDRIHGLLSTYLGSSVYQQIKNIITVSGEQQIGELDCVILKIEGFRSTGKQADTRQLTLARNRNYLPVRLESCAFNYNRSLPIEIGTADDFREIEPGIWLPYQVKIIVYDEIPLSKGEVVQANTTDYTITECKLDPHYDVSFFRNIPFPDGTIVHEVTDGKITKSYVQGAKPEAAGAKWYLWLIAIVNLILLCLLVRYLYRRWQRRSIARASAF